MEILAIANEVTGTCLSESEIIERFNLTIDEGELIELLLDFNVERCRGCGWWFDSFDLVGEDDNDIGYCEDCKEEQ